MVESARQKALVLAFAFSTVSLANCGGDPGPNDGGGNGGDSGGMSDGGSGGSDGGSGGDGGGTSLCAQYGPGDPHRHVFELEASASPSGGATFLRFMRIIDGGSEKIAGFTYYPADLSTSEDLSFRLGQQRVKTVSGIGNITMELCEMTANPCTPSTGDPNCTATLASSNGW
jgi:hypothetical protein